MIIEQSEIDALIAQAQGLAEEAEQADAAETTVAAPPPGRVSSATPSPSAELNRILHLRVPVIVQLARRAMTIAGVRELSVGAIIEFEKSVEHELDLLIKNRLIGHGHCVKVGENFGLRISRIRSREERIRSLGA